MQNQCQPETGMSNLLLSYLLGSKLSTTTTTETATTTTAGTATTETTATTATTTTTASTTLATDGTMDLIGIFDFTLDIAGTTYQLSLQDKSSSEYIKIKDEIEKTFK